MTSVVYVVVITLPVRIVLEYPMVIAGKVTVDVLLLITQVMSVMTVMALPMVML